MTGSSARKLKQGGANLLAGRAFVYHLYPFSFLELEKEFDLDTALSWGTLPDIFELARNEDRKDFLEAYSHTYLKEEIWGEHAVNRLEPFRKFLEVAAQSNGQIVNYTKIARDVGVTDKTVKSYFSILEDTLLGFFLEPFHNSLRKKLSGKPKFYFFDHGVARALSSTLTVPLRPQTNVYDYAFEHYILTEFVRLVSYFKLDYKFSFIRTAAGLEVDLVLERPGKTTLFIKIKSTDNVEDRTLTHFKKLTKNIGNSEAICLSNDPFTKKFDHVISWPWQQGIQHILECKDIKS